MAGKGGEKGRPAGPRRRRFHRRPMTRPRRSSPTRSFPIKVGAVAREKEGGEEERKKEKKGYTRRGFRITQTVYLSYRYNEGKFLEGTQSWGRESRDEEKKRKRKKEKKEQQLDYYLVPFYAFSCSCKPLSHTTS